MLTHETNTFQRCLRGFLAGSARALFAFGLVTLPSFALERVSGSPPPTNGAGGQVAGDETVGTLPILGPGAPFDLLRHVLEREACFFLEGHRIDVFGAIVSASGRMAVTMHVIDPMADTVRVTFHGRPRLVLDRWMVESGLLRVGVDVPSAFGLGTAQARFGARVLAPLVVTPGQVDLLTAPFLAANLNTARRLTYEFHGQSGAHTLLGLRVTRNFLLIEQTH